jgi:glycolate oxidase FAD binding subunit
MPRRPTSSEELAQQIRTARETGTRVRISGSAGMPITRFDAESPGRAVQTISTLRLNKVIEHAISDMTVIVQAGITLEALQRHLAWQNQWLPVDPPVIGSSGRAPGQRTIGGVIATNSLGPMRFGIGDWRLLVMGMKWIDAEGRLLRGGGRTVKNVAGYSTPRMMIGSCGTLGAIAEVTLRTFARSLDERCVIFFCRSAAEAETLLAAVLTAPVSPTYVEAIGGRTFAGNPLQLPAPGGKAGGMALVVGFLGRTEACGTQVETVRGLPEARGIESISQTAAQTGRLRLWLTTEPVAPEAGAGFRLHVRSSRVCDAVAALDAADSGNWIVSEAGSGVVRGTISARTLETLRQLTSDGQVAWTQGDIPAYNGDMNRRLKEQLDPTVLFGSL